MSALIYKTSKSYVCSQIDTDTLSASFPTNYYECSTLPRRFVVDISSYSRDATTLLIVEVFAVYEEYSLCR
jgi:hypothetical protein